MDSVLPVFEGLREDNHYLTIRLLEKINCFHRIPQLRRTLTRIALQGLESDFPAYATKDLNYLVSGLAAISGCNVCEILQPDLIRELSAYLRLCRSFGVSIRDFLSGSTRKWSELQSEFQEESRIIWFNALIERFSEIKGEDADSAAIYLLCKNLARVTSPFPFHNGKFSAPVTLVRAQPDLPWSIASQPADYVMALCTHFPQIDWRGGHGSKTEFWFVGLRLLSALSVKTSLVLAKSLNGLNYLCTTWSRNKKKLINVVFYSEGDAKLFKFNLMHYSKLYTTYYQFIPVTLSDYRRGYPGFSGFFERETIGNLGLDPFQPDSGVKY
jgi:hypothetical protein